MEMFHHRIKVITQGNSVLICCDLFSLKRQVETKQWQQNTICRSCHCRGQTSWTTVKDDVFDHIAFPHISTEE